MAAINDLSTLLASLEPALDPGRYAYVALPLGCRPDGIEALASFREREGWTLVVAAEVAAAHGLPVLFEAAWITLTVHSDLAAVGLTAAFAQALGERGISCNVIAAAYHDHLFVPVEQAEAAMEALHALQRAHAIE
ncbi:ACT domain-containing protein [Chitinimonas koreensis]|uniref:ACT domain-containing protein n=1 Tax=Chitinimonas koreensis TaxID=356302 RepID=UPI00040086F6|nr:ACT domain-containing protein [Chitinimonas koreensis]QNM97464.1 ACT domain-containing protein [Chitinimonas koreensis]